jgi:hypothetical protein
MEPYNKTILLVYQGFNVAVVGVRSHLVVLPLKRLELNVISGMTKELLDSCVGIHPTTAEDVIGLSVTKEDNPDASKGNC